MTDWLEDPWRPGQYERFKHERSQPFFDLLDMVQPRPGMRALDAGCGTGRLTRELHRRLGLASTLGVDSSGAMLAAAEGQQDEGLRFQLRRIEDLEDLGPFDLIFSNAALQWIDDHPALLERLTGYLAPGGQLAVQVPANHDHPSHRLAAEVAREEPFRTALIGYVRRSPVLDPDVYSALLHRLGYVEQNVRLQVYPHLLESADEVVEWVKGTLLTQYQRRMPEPMFDEFLSRYRDLLMPLLDQERPYFYAFKRILIWGIRP